MLPMPGRRAVGAFPWDAVSRTSRRAELRLRRARRWLDAHVDLASFAARLGELAGVALDVVVRDVTEQPPLASSWRLGFSTRDAAVQIGLALEAPLASALLSSFLRRPIPIVPSELTAEAALLGALSALMLEAARATGGADSLRPAPPAELADAVFVQATVVVSGRPYAAAAWFRCEVLGEQPAPAPSPELARLGALALELPIVIGVGLSTARDLAGLTRNAAFCPGPGLWVSRSGVGRAVLAAGTSELGLAAELLPDGKIVVGEATRIALVTTESMVKSDAPPSGLEQAVLDAPVVVRVELASVSLSAREWASLKAGDVIETRRRIGGPVVLRAGGRALAHGELVNIDGELGVRVTRILPEESP
jgi:flagellar motor switch/type III secretory pathway protein FliN